jgi:alpha-tubulin suppressor-like RCC1 family protein
MGRGYFFMAVKSDGTLWAWGPGTDGALGQGNTVNYSSPVQVGSLTDWDKVAVRRTNAYAIKTNGILWAWGANGNGQCGQNNVIKYSSPVQMGSDTDWNILAANTWSLQVLKE